MSNLNGILLVDKPYNFTSFDVIGKLRPILKTKKIGHSGTLDPMATGVLPLFIGNATKAIDFLDDNSKSYIATIKFGIETDTYDITGKVIKTNEADVSLSDIKDILPLYIGEIKQKPPIYSAIKVNGQKLYNIARKGKSINIQSRKVFIENICILDFDKSKKELTICVDCKKGTYIRSLANDIGKSLNTCACLSYLRRTRSNNFVLEDCFTIDEIISFVQSNNISEKLIKVENLFDYYEKIFLDKKNSILFNNGVKICIDKLNLKNTMGYFKVFDSNKKFLAIAFVDEENYLRVRKFFKE